MITAGDLDVVNAYLRLSALRAKVAGFERAPMINVKVDAEDEPPPVKIVQDVTEFLRMLPELADANRDVDMGRGAPLSNQRQADGVPTWSSSTRASTRLRQPPAPRTAS